MSMDELRRKRVEAFVKQVRGQLIVSCQALAHEDENMKKIKTTKSCDGLFFIPDFPEQCRNEVFVDRRESLTPIRLG